VPKGDATKAEEGQNHLVVRWALHTPSLSIFRTHLHIDQKADYISFGSCDFVRRRCKKRNLKSRDKDFGSIED
jgi:hypothetical protein